MPGRSASISRSSVRVIGVLVAASVVAITPGAAVPPSAIISQHRAPPTWERLDLKDGDLIFRAGTDLAARIILSQGQEAVYSHVGLIVLQGKRPWVLHAIPDEPDTKGGVLLEPLESFGAPEHASRTAIYRLPGLSPIQRQQIRRYAIAQLGKPFDMDFSLRSEDAFYCTELALKALLAAGIDERAKVLLMDLPVLNEPVLTPENLRLALAADPGIFPLYQQP